jgi:phosphoadenosine phosphosulfate reductase
MSILTDTQRVFTEARARTGNAIIVAFSGGKDSLVIMDLACRMFERVEGFFMYLVPGLECVEDAIEAARQRFNVKIRLYPHWILQKLIAQGIYTSEWFGYEALPKWSLRDVYAYAIRDIGINCVATGAKATDSAWRRRFMSTAHFDSVINPIANWHKYDVVSYLRAHGIPEPPSSGKSATGVDLSVPSLLWLNDSYPADFKRLCGVFPFAQAVVARRDFYGVAE